jgi:hypothetical protein
MLSFTPIPGHPGDVELEFAYPFMADHSHSKQELSVMVKFFTVGLIVGGFSASLVAVAFAQQHAMPPTKIPPR